MIQFSFFFADIVNSIGLSLSLSFFSFANHNNTKRNQFYLYIRGVSDVSTRELRLSFPNLLVIGATVCSKRQHSISIACLHLRKSQYWQIDSGQTSSEHASAFRLVVRLSRDLLDEYVLSDISLVVHAYATVDEEFQNYDTSGHLLYLLFKLNELTLGHFQHSLILIGHQAFFNLPSMSQIEAELGVLTPTTLFIPAYTRSEVVSILQQILLRRFP